MITREDMVEQSLTDYVRAGLEARDYGSLVNIREAFPTPQERATPITVSQLAVGFNFDDGGRMIELGSDLTEREYTIEFWVFGKSHLLGRNIANVVRAVIEENDGALPLKNIGVVGQPQVDVMVVKRVRVSRQISRDPHPWDMHVFTTMVVVEDVYYPSLTD